jgi:hypothetical protein
MAMAGFLKPSKDPRTAAQFSTDNWKFCQKEYVQSALRVSAEAPKELAAASADTVGALQGLVSITADVFFDLWKFCYEAYSSFMDKMKGAAKLFHGFMINLYSIVQRLNASALSIIFGMIGLIVTIINSIQVTLIVAIIVIGIITALQILLFYITFPISSLILTVTAMISTVVVAVSTAIAAAMVAELFVPGACFAKGTRVHLQGGSFRPIEEVKIGDMLGDGGRVTAVHVFWSNDRLYSLDGVKVTGDHLVGHVSGKRVYVMNHPDAEQAPDFRTVLRGGQYLYCLTTTTRFIPCVGRTGIIAFADWEEIDASDMTSLRAWYRDVWFSLNGSPAPAGFQEAEAGFLEAEAGLASDCLVVCEDWLGQRIHRRLSDIRVGDRVFSNDRSLTTVVGNVRITGELKTDAVELPTGGVAQIVSCGTWVSPRNGKGKNDPPWTPAASKGLRSNHHVAQWEHLYTESGTFLINGGWCIRDASDVGLANLRPLVESIVLK